MAQQTPYYGNTQPSPPRIDRRLLTQCAQPVILIALMWVIEIVDTVLPLDITRFGVHAWDPAFLPAVFYSPLLHAGWGHLVANTLPFLIFGCVVALEGVRRFWYVTIVTAVCSGLGAWVVALPGTITVGASGLVFGYFLYLVARMWFIDSLLRKIVYGAIGFTIIVVYGASMVFGLLPLHAGISWQGHLFGALGGLLAAWLLRDKR